MKKLKTILIYNKWSRYIADIDHFHASLATVMRNDTVVSGALARFFTFRLYSWQRLFMGWCGLGKKYAANRVVFDRFGNAGKSVMIEYICSTLVWLTKCRCFGRRKISRGARRT